MSIARVGFFLLCAAAVSFTFARAADLRFEVASVKPTPPGGQPRGVPLVISHGRIILGDASLRQIAREAAADEKGGLDDRPGQRVFRKTAMSSLAAFAANALNTPVEDMTGLKGLYDFTLKADSAAPFGSGDARDILPNALDGIGLRLEAGKRSPPMYWATTQLSAVPGT